MTRATAERLVERWRRRLVPEWRVEVFAEHAEVDANDCHGAIQAHDTYRNARLVLPDHGLDRPAGDVEITLVHELLHLLLRDLAHSADSLETHAARAAWTMFCDYRSKAEEEVVDRLARALVALEHPDSV